MHGRQTCFNVVPELICWLFVTWGWKNQRSLRCLPLGFCWRAFRFSEVFLLLSGFYRSSCGIFTANWNNQMFQLLEISNQKLQKFTNHLLLLLLFPPQKLSICPYVTNTNTRPTDNSTQWIPKSFLYVSHSY